MSEFFKKAGRCCQRHPLLSLAGAVLAPHAFLFLMGLLCKLAPQLLGASAVYLAGYLLLWAAGLGLWGRAVIGKIKKNKGEQK